MAFMALQAPGDDSAHLIYEFERRAYPVRNSLLTIGRDAASLLSQVVEIKKMLRGLIDRLSEQ